MQIPSLTLALAAIVSLGLAVPAQKAGSAEANHRFNIDSKWIDNNTNSSRVVFSHVLRIKDSAWMRVFFDKTNLPKSSYLRLTSLYDRAAQRLDGRSIIDYGYASCYLNGDAVRIELVAGPNTKSNRVLIIAATVGVGAAETICGPTDDRKESFDKRGGRFKGGCSGWLFAKDAIGSAGHCGNHLSTMLVEFNVPRSTSSGSKVRSHPNDQYPTTAGTGGRSTGLGNDWLVTKIGKNSNTKKLPGEAQGSWYRIGSVPTTTVGQNIRITGYGTSAVRILNQVQKTHVGPMFALSGTYLRYQTDTTGGNSGSPVIHENTGLLVGVHTHGGCTTTGGGNHGTRIDRPALQAALKGLIGSVGSAVPYDSGCKGTSGTPVHSVIGAPNIGKSISLRTVNLPANAKGIQIIGGTQVSIDLTSLGMKGCFQLASLDIVIGLNSNAAGVAQLNAAIPNDTGLIGVVTYTQHAADDSAASSTVVSNGVKITIGYQ